ncbi:hypothetical protein J7E97_32245 [Streptomyces sp. ISL-66]|uniref:hypothetical protein n=1 Tax=Streptomyces sp. ISL-66 TaxID=2819186 RepID=UPI001BE5779E|nr:hypothetical protein [Streptomyces sp. ISL-66]MBT2472395.1 hypothetical protein [Streptomyces sp. ISL-66]
MAVTAVVSVSAAVLLAGCGNAVQRDEVGSAGEIRLASPSACPESVPGPGTPRAAPTLIDGTPANTPEGERLSRAVGEQGRGAFADVYSTQITDHPAGRVALCVTDLARGRLLVSAAHVADPEADPARADLYLSPYSRRALDAAADELIRLKAGFPIHTVSGQRGTELKVTSSQASAMSAEFKARLEEAAGGIPVRVTKGEPVRTAEDRGLTAEDQALTAP